MGVYILSMILLVTFPVIYFQSEFRIGFQIIDAY